MPCSRAAVALGARRPAPHPRRGDPALPVSGRHLFVGNVEVLSHGLRSGCHRDGLFEFPIGIEPEFSGNLKRRGRKEITKSSKQQPQAKFLTCAFHLPVPSFRLLSMHHRWKGMLTTAMRVNEEKFSLLKKSALSKPQDHYPQSNAVSWHY